MRYTALTGSVSVRPAKTHAPERRLLDLTDVEITGQRIERDALDAIEAQREYRVRAVGGDANDAPAIFFPDVKVAVGAERYVVGPVESADRSGIAERRDASSAPIRMTRPPAFLGR